MASAFQIEKGIPAPTRASSQYPFSDMVVGDSFFVPGAKSSADISSSISYRKHRYDEKYRCRAVEGGVRVWRIA